MKKKVAVNLPVEMYEEVEAMAKEALRTVPAQLEFLLRATLGHDPKSESAIKHRPEIPD